MTDEQHSPHGDPGRQQSEVPQGQPASASPPPSEAPPDGQSPDGPWAPPQQPGPPPSHGSPPQSPPQAISRPAQQVGGSFSKTSTSQANQFLDWMTETRTSQFGAVVRSIAELLAVLIFLGAGFKMIGIESVAGNSVAEAFYNGMGWVSVGVAVTLVAVFLRPR